MQKFTYMVYTFSNEYHQPLYTFSSESNVYPTEII